MAERAGVVEVECSTAPSDSPWTAGGSAVKSQKTRLTKTGQPVMGTTIEVAFVDGTWERAKVVGKGTGRDGHTLVLLIVEWEDGGRQQIDWRQAVYGEDWRSVDG